MKFTHNIHVSNRCIVLYIEQCVEREREIECLLNGTNLRFERFLFSGWHSVQIVKSKQIAL